MSPSIKMKLSYPYGFITLLHSGCGSSSGLGHIRLQLTPVYLAISLLMITATCVEPCVFPDYMQSSVNGSDVRDWRGLIRNQNREVNLK